MTSSEFCFKDENLLFIEKYMTRTIITQQLCVAEISKDSLLVTQLNSCLIYITMD